MSKHCSLQETAALLQAANKIVLCSHVSPDGDTLGSALSLMKALQKLGKDVIVTVDDEISKVYKFLPGIESFVRFQNDERIAADLLVVIDASSLDRAGNVSQCVSAPKTLNIDHHISNTEYADYLYLDTAAAATGEIMYELIDTLGIEVDLEMATCIYTALYTDCGSFKYSNTMPKTMRIAAALLEIGVKPNEISDSMEIKPRSNIEMLTKVLETLTFDADGKIAYISINNEMYDKDVDTDTFISYPRYIEGVEVAIMFKAVEKAVTRVSMRSRNLDVSEIAITFGGGGHLRGGLVGGDVRKDDDRTAGEDEAQHKLGDVGQEIFAPGVEDGQIAQRRPHHKASTAEQAEQNIVHRAPCRAARHEGQRHKHQPCEQGDKPRWHPVLRPFFAARGAAPRGSSAFSFCHDP